MPEKIQPENESSLIADQLVDGAVLSFAQKDYDALDQNLLKLGQELGVELETKYDKTLAKSQKLYDTLFPERNLNLKALFTEGKLPFPDKTQEKALFKEGYREYLIVPNNLKYQDLEDRINKYYQEKIPNYQKVYHTNEAKEDILKIKAQEEKEEEQDGFLLLALRQDPQTRDAHPETTNKTLQEQLDVLAKEQTNHPDLNLRGTKLKEALLYEALVFTTTGQHADDSSKSWSYNRCLEDSQTNDQGQPLRAPDLYWGAGGRRLGVASHSHSNGNIGARFAAVFST